MAILLVEFPEVVTDVLTVLTVARASVDPDVETMTAVPKVGLPVTPTAISVLLGMTCSLYEMSMTYEFTLV